MSHTPGPWKVFDGRPCGTGRLLILSPDAEFSNREVVIARIENQASGRPLTKEDEATAREFVSRLKGDQA